MLRWLACLMGLHQVKPGSVLRDVYPMQAVCEHCKRRYEL